MPKRPRSHQLESEARGKLKEVFDVGHGWSVEDIHQDYGEDLLVRIFRQRKATPFSFYVQSKATDSISRARKRSSKFSVPISKAHVKHWAGFWEPVFVTLYDSKSAMTYWECIQIFLETKTGSSRLKGRGKTMVIDVPEANLLNKIGVKRIFHITRERFQRYHHETMGVEFLFSLLEERAGLKVVDYNFRTGILILEDRKGRQEHLFFGRGREMLEFILNRERVSYNKFLSKALDRTLKCWKKDPKTGEIAILDDTGTLTEKYDNLEDWHFAERVRKESRDPDYELKTVRKLRRAFSKQKNK